MDTEKSGQAGHERDQEPVPRLPRGAGFRVSWPAVFRILMFAALLVGVLMLREPCASSVAHFVGQFDATDAGADASGATGSGNHGDVAPDERLPPGTYVHITGDMSEEEIANALRQAGVEQPGPAPGDAGVTDAPPAD